LDVLPGHIMISVIATR